MILYENLRRNRNFSASFILIHKSETKMCMEILPLHVLMLVVKLILDSLIYLPLLVLQVCVVELGLLLLLLLYFRLTFLLVHLEELVLI